jgi:lambda repressor-like predicted transcriptional regulator
MTTTFDDSEHPKTPETLATSASSHRHKQYLSPSQINELIGAYETGATTKELGELYGIHRTTISAILKRNGVALRFQSLGAKDIALAQELYQSGLSLAKVSSRFSCHPNTVRLALKDHGVQMRDCHWRDS